MRVSSRTPLLSILLEGSSNTGKTAVAAFLGAESEFPFVRVLSADAMVGFSEASKCATILKAFQDSSRSPLSVIILDDLERLIDYSPIGPRFSNTVVQTLLVLLKKPPASSEKRLLVIGTTSVASHLEDLQLVQGFNVTLNVPQLTGMEEIKTVLREGKLCTSHTHIHIYIHTHRHHPSFFLGTAFDHLLTHIHIYTHICTHPQWRRRCRRRKWMISLGRLESRLGLSSC